MIAKSNTVAIEYLRITYRIDPVGVRFFAELIGARLPAYFQILWSLSLNEKNCIRIHCHRYCI